MCNSLRNLWLNSQWLTPSVSERRTGLALDRLEPFEQIIGKIDRKIAMESADPKTMTIHQTAKSEFS